MKELFYSNKEKRLFWIPNYYTCGSSSLNQLLKNLQEAKDILNQFDIEGDIQCGEIYKSRRYKGKWYFTIQCSECPKAAFELGDNWDMWKWIED